MRGPEARLARWGAVVGVVTWLAAAAPAAAQTETRAPDLRFHVGGEELLPIAYPERYASGDALARDVAWAGEASDELREWWDREGALYLRRVTDLAGMAWPYEAIDVYPVRHWPVLSIERPLVVALGSIRSSAGVVDLPDDLDARVLVLAHQVVHYLLDDPTFLPADAHDPVYDHPFLRPGDFAVEAMVNWLAYEALADVWGPERLRRAAASDLWRGYNPNHRFVTGELLEGWSLSRTRTLRDWLLEHPEGSEILALADRYREEAGIEAPPAEDRWPREGRAGTGYGADLGASFDGEVFVAFVDEGSPAARAGLVRGDVLRTVEGRRVPDVVEARRWMDEAWRRDGEIDLSVLRDGEEVYLTVEE